MLENTFYRTNVIKKPLSKASGGFVTLDLSISYISGRNLNRTFTLLVLLEETNIKQLINWTLSEESINQ